MSEPVNVHLIFGVHGDIVEPTPLITGFRKRLMLTAAETPGKIAVLMEYTNLPGEAGQRLRAQLGRNLLPSQAIINTILDSAGPWMSKDEYEQTKQKGYGDKFHTGFWRTLDEAYTVHPERMKLLPESMPEHEVNLGAGRARIYLRNVRRLVAEGRDREAKAIYTTLVNWLGRYSLIREQRVTENLLKEVEKDPEITAAVALFGEAHTGLSRELRAAGFSVKREFPNGKPDFGEYNFATLSRYVRFFPDRPFPYAALDKAFRLAVKRYRKGEDMFKQLSLFSLVPAEVGGSVAFPTGTPVH